MKEPISITHNPDKTILRQVRERMGITQRKMAELFSISQPYIHFLETKRDRMNLQHTSLLVELAAKHGIIIQIADIQSDYF